MVSTVQIIFTTKQLCHDARMMIWGRETTIVKTGTDKWKIKTFVYTSK